MFTLPALALAQAMKSGTVRVDRDVERDAHDSRDRRDIAGEVEAEIVVERLVDGAGHADQQQRVAVGRRVGDELGRDVGGGARPILDDELLAGPLGQPLAHQAGDDVVAARGREADDPAHRSARIGLGRRKTGQRHQRGGARRQVENVSAG
jgi:hypothetical protein